MGWHPYDLDHLAQEIVLKARNSAPDSLNQAYKMRAACAYGLERFWGEHLRLADKEPAKARFVADVWSALVGIMAKAKVSLPGAMVNRNASEVEIQSVAEHLWHLDLSDQQACLAVLTSLCDAVVWWTQRLKTGKGDDE